MERNGKRTERPLPQNAGARPRNTARNRSAAPQTMRVRAGGRRRKRGPNRGCFVVVLLCLLAAGGVLTGCGGSKKTMEPRAFVDDVLANANFTDSLSQLDDAVIPQYYGVDSADYKSALVYCGTAATAEQIVCFEANDAAAAQRLLTALQAFVADRIEAYKSYGPAAAMSLENAPVKTIGNYVVAVVCADSDSAIKVVDQYA